MMTKLGQHLQTPRHLRVDNSSPLHHDDNTSWSTVGERRVEAKSTIIVFWAIRRLNISTPEE